MWFILLLIAPCLAFHMQEPLPPARSSRLSPVEGWVQVRLNHFMAYDTRTYPMRYYYNNEFAGARGNLVIFVGGEWAISEGWTQAGLAYELAKKMGAGLFYTEHRFYGSSRPFADSALPNLSFLSIDQALADLAQFIQYIKSDDFEYGRFRNAKVALVGCSYAGTMATWMRLAYPHVVDAAFSDSGPLLAQENFPEYLEVVAEAIREQGGETCLNNIEEAMRQLVVLVNSTAGANQVSEMFKTCTPLQAGIPLDVATFFWYGITETFAGLVQGASPGDIPAACVKLNDTSVASHVQRLANYITSDSWNQPCIETRYTQVVANHRNTSFDAYESTSK
ncbi:hypothetical protein PYW07_010703 [Mythimna separata]|uniref:Serine protease K12H4.7 n=1 Tax=Mythimna separata TaxID=271217 RepID=A0AAD7Y7V2_MYTSE|nr:hypothetical protein PYW07_010703 [Mythimna separata]